MKKLSILFFLTLASSVAFPVTMNFTGTFRTEATLYNGLGLGLANQEKNKSFILGRGLLTPNLVIDDHFSLKSQWSVLHSPGLTPNASTSLGLSHGQGGYIFGDPSASKLLLNRAWLEWTSDFGVLRVGRMPVSWGYGLVYDAGNGVWDDFQTTLDRLEYRIFFGRISTAVAYSKGRKLSVLGSQNDQEFYAVYLQYDNPEQEVEWGALFEKQARSGSQAADLTTTANPLHLPSSTYAGTVYPLGIQAPYPISNNVVDVFFKKRFGSFVLGGEISWVVGDALSLAPGNPKAETNSLAGIVNASLEMDTVKTFVELLYAGGDSNLSDGNSNGFYLLHRNRRPGLILGRELLGNYNGNGAGLGSLTVYGNSNSFSGVYYVRPGIRVDWSPSWATGLEVIWAQKAAKTQGEPGDLGIEIDFGVDHAVYKNFDVGAQLGYLIAGNGLGVPSPPGVFGIRAQGAIKF